MRPRILVASRFLIHHAAGDQIDDQVDAVAAGRLLRLGRPIGVAGVEREVGAVFLEPRPARRIGRGADNERRAHDFGDLHSHQAHAGAGALHQKGLAALEPAGGDHRVMHGLQRHRKARRLLVGHVVGGDAMNAPGVSSDELGEAARRRAHDTVAGLDALHLGADRLDLAGTFQAKARADAADAAVLVARGDDEIGAVETRGPHPDQDLVRLWLGFRQVADLDALLADDGSFHGGSSNLQSLLKSSRNVLYGGESSARVNGRRDSGR